MWLSIKNEREQRRGELEITYHRPHLYLLNQCKSARRSENQGNADDFSVKYQVFAVKHELSTLMR